MNKQNIPLHIALTIIMLLLTGNSIKTNTTNKIHTQTLKMQEMKSMTNGLDNFITINGVKFHYRDFGNSDAPPLLILHGLSGHAWEFDSVARALLEKFHVLSLNQRGHGDSDWAADYSPELMANDAAVFIDSLNLGKVVVIGHSMGGVNGWWLAAKYPEKVSKLVIIDINPATICRADMTEIWKNIFRHYSEASYPTLEEGIQDYLSFYNGTKKELLIEFAKNSLKQVKDGKWIWKLDSNNLIKWIEATSGSEKTHWELLSQIKSSTLIIYAGDSPFSDNGNMEKMAGSIPNSNLVRIPHAGHDIHFDQFELLMNAITEFLNTRDVVYEK